MARRARISAAKRELVIDAYEGRCAVCDVESDALTIDHIVPQALGGGDTFANLRATCEACNQAKADRIDGQARPGRLAELTGPKARARELARVRAKVGVAFAFAGGGLAVAK